MENRCGSSRALVVAVGFHLFWTIEQPEMAYTLFLDTIRASNQAWMMWTIIIIILCDNGHVWSDEWRTRIYRIERGVFACIMGLGSGLAKRNQITYQIACMLWASASVCLYTSNVVVVVIITQSKYYYTTTTTTITDQPPLKNKID